MTFRLSDFYGFNKTIEKRLYIHKRIFPNLKQINFAITRITDLDYYRELFCISGVKNIVFMSDENFSDVMLFHVTDELRFRLSNMNREFFGMCSFKYINIGISKGSLMRWQM